eukprot:TRINITY_DN1995_c0_g1_i3.p2 TRINITY_DN1995_c0_g1~~TRINITY_DN1995_c0_g1_i3.p2  ORF type:complete len:293 (+),score=30.97 TRINITY_DN1995_c0_g1_i3:1132-2010(+)
MIKPLLLAREALPLVKHPLLSSEWVLLEGLVPLLDPVLSLNKVLEKNANMSLVYPMMSNMIETLNEQQPLHPELQKVRAAMLKVVQGKWKELCAHLPSDMKLAPIILDPQVRASTMYAQFNTSLRHQREIRDCEASLRSKLPAPVLQHVSSSDDFSIEPKRPSSYSENSDPVSLADAPSDLLTTYLTLCDTDPPKLDSRKRYTETSTQWYRRHPELDPVSVLFREYCLPAATCSVEKLWKKARRRRADFLTSLKDENFSELLFLRHNAPLLELLGIRCRFVDVDSENIPLTL